MEHPAHVPAAATWDADGGEWCLSERDDEGRRHGSVAWWRADGTRCCVTDYLHGTAHGRFQRFHDDGSPSRTGIFVEGQLEGTNVFLRSDAPTRETFPAGMADTVWRCEMDYEAGRVVAARAYDREGNRVLEDGEPYPFEEPPGVPSSAHFRDGVDGWQWVHGVVEDRGDGTIARQGVWRWWSPTGELKAERAYVGGELHGLQVLYEDAVAWSTSTFVEGEETGPFERRAAPGRYRLPVHSERGTLRKGDVVGTLHLFDAAGAELATVEPGEEVAQELVIEALHGAHDDGAVRRLEEAGLPAGAFLAAVMARRPVASLTERLSALQPPLSPEAVDEATQRTLALAQNVSRFGGGPAPVVSTLLDGLRIGGDAGDLLRQGAAMLDDLGSAEVASAWIDAACALDADVVGHEYTRSLIRMSLGDASGALAAIDRLGTEVEEAAAQMRAYHHAVFRGVSTDVAGDPRLALAEALAPRLASSVVASVPDAAVVRRTLQQLATRVAHSRVGLAEAFGDVPWAPPSLDHLLPAGPVEVEMPNARGIGWMHEARKDLLRFRWLCWVLGLDGRSLPTTVALDTARPSRALVLVVVARALVLNGQEPDLSDWLDAEREDVDAIQAALRAGLERQHWHGIGLTDCDGGTRNFAFQDEHVLFELLYRSWDALHTVFEQ